MTAPDQAAQTVDAFHRGRFFLVQPAAGGHRAGMDAMMLAASVPTAFAGRLADFGAGAGAAGFAVLSRCAGAGAVLVERSPEMVAFAELTLAHPHNTALQGRATVLKADVTLAGRARVAAGLADNAFDFVIMNPPFARQADIDHVLHAFRFLKPGGVLVSIMSAGVMFREDRKTKAFREFIDDHAGTVERLPSGSFKASGTMVEACVVKMSSPKV